jgi:hypothetical protein
LLDAKERARANPAATAKSEAQSAERPSSEPPFNPLAKYMADWMSPKEYALLKPVAEKSDLDGFSGAQDSTASSSGQTGFDLSTLAGLAGTSGSANNSPVFSAPTSTENPFLAGLVAPDSGPASLPPTSQVPPVVAPPAATPPPTAPVPAERSTIPDFAKPAIDDKYFKPLKRF